MRARTRIAGIATLLLLGCVSTVTAVGCVPVPRPRPRIFGTAPLPALSRDRGSSLTDPTPAPTRSELKAIDFGEVVAAEHHDVSGVVAMSMMKGLRTSDVKITLVVNGGQSVATLVKPDGTSLSWTCPPGRTCWRRSRWGTASRR